MERPNVRPFDSTVPAYTPEQAEAARAQMREGLKILTEKELAARIEASEVNRVLDFVERMLPIAIGLIRGV